MSMGSPSVWTANAGVNGVNVPTKAYLSGVEIPVALDGVLIYVNEETEYYKFSLDSGAVIDGDTVLSTNRGGASRWLKLNTGGGGTGGLDMFDEGVPLAGNPQTQLNVVGATVSLTLVGGVPTLQVTATAGGAPAVGNKDMTASVTTVDGSLACATAIAATPPGASYVSVAVNGVLASVGNGVKTKQCYFSGDGGTTARAFGAIVAGDFCYWNGTIAGFQLDGTYKLDFLYNS